jgi:hypothetical protein
MDVQELEWDDANETKISERVDPDDVEHIFQGRWAVIRNKRSGTGKYRVMGLGRSGQLITVVRYRPGRATAKSMPTPGMQE